MAESLTGSPVYGNFLDLQTEVKPWLQIPSIDTSRDFALELIVNGACSWVQTYLGRPVGRTSYHWLFDGWSGWMGTMIMLPWMPVLSVDNVIEYRGASGAYTLEEIPPNATGVNDGWQCEYATGRLIRVFTGNVQKPWFPGSRNIDVQWTAGYNPIPIDIKLATLEFIGHWFRNTQQGGPGAPQNFDPMVAQGLWQGVPSRITSLLMPYMRVGMS